MPSYQTVTGNVGATPAIIDVSSYNSPYTVTIIPGSGNTSKVEYSLTETAISNPSTANWLTWPAGSVSIPTNDIYNGKLKALRFTRVSGSSNDTFEVRS